MKSKIHEYIEKKIKAGSKQILMGLSLMAMASVTHAQNWTSYNLQSDKYPVTVNFPASPSKSPAVNATDTTTTYTAAAGGVTYVLIASRVKTPQIAAETAGRTNKKLGAKAQKVDVEQASSIAGTASQYMKYVSTKGTCVITHSFAAGRVMYQAMVMKPKTYATDEQASAFFNSVQTTGTSNNIQPAFTNTVNNTSTAAFKTNDRVEIFYPKENKWYKGTVLAVNANNTYRVNYDGYGSEYDENVTADKLRLLPGTTAFTNTNVNNTTTSNPTTNTTTNAAGSYAVNDRVEVFDTKENKWYRAIVLKVNSATNTYRIAYDGYAETYDEDVTTDRMRGMTNFSALPNITYVKTVKGQTTKVSGNLNKGAIVDDLEWATTSQMACWPSIRDVEFEGNHVAYWMDMPKKSIVKITVTPRSNKTRINIFGYSSIDPTHLIPNIISCTSCEASHPTWIGEPNLNEPSVPQTIEFNATTRHNTIYFAVAGARGVTAGDYDITIEVK